MITSVQEITSLLNNKENHFTKGHKEQVKCGICGREYFASIPVMKKYLTNDKIQCQNCSYKQTMLLKYGVVNAFQIKEVKNRIFSARDENFYKSVHKKMEETCLRKYNTKVSSQSDIVKKKQASTMINRYGCISPILNAEVFEKSKKTCLKNYGVEHYLSKKDPHIKSSISRRLESIKSLNELCLNNGLELLDDFNGNYDVNGPIYYNFKCLKCGSIIKRSPHNKHLVKCIKCDPFLNGTSKGEKEVVDFIRLHYCGEIIQNTRSIIKPKEIDIWLPDINLGIEYDGIYWHSDSLLLNEKTNLMQAQNKKLIHIFQSDWILNRHIIQDILKSKIGIYDKKLFARNLLIKEISTNDYRQFCIQNHLQGCVNASIRIGLFNGDDLVQIMSFSKSRFKKENCYEMIRECSKSGFLNIGGKSKLLKYFEKKYQPKKIISYCDRKIFNGESYEKLGFRLDHISKPNYYYFKNGQFQLHSRLNFQKHKLKSFKYFEESKSEHEIMKENGYLRIFDCGNNVYIKENKK